MQLSKEIFRALDIRGKVGRDITEESAYWIGRGAGTYFQKQSFSRVVVGGDNRTSSEALRWSLVQGLSESGCDVLDIGCVPTPVLYYASVQEGEIPAIMTTASHLSSAYNGFKLSTGVRPIFGEELLKVCDFAAVGNLAHEQGSVERREDVLPRYLEEFARLPSAAVPLKIVLDAGNGTSCLVADQVFRRLGYDVSTIFFESDGTFPNHLPDPSIDENLKHLSACVVATEADLGFAFDGDSDRVGVVDNLGNVIAVDRIAVLLARELLVEEPASTIVMDILCSQVLIDEIEAHGGTPVLWKSGHSYVKAKLLETGAALGIELSGHTFFRAWFGGFDDGVYAAVRIANMVAASGLSLSTLMATVPAMSTRGEYRPHCPEEDKTMVVNAVREHFMGRNDVIDIDGVRVDFGSGWGLVRASNTEAVLSMRFEAVSPELAREYEVEFRDVLRRFPQIGGF